MVTNSTQKIQPELEGVLVVNKPAGMTSHDVIYRLRRITGMQRIGHTGTLDPFATGVLLIAFGRATRLVEYSHAFPKTYTAEATLGATSTTDDLTGDITQNTISREPSASEVEKALSTFVGSIEQMPPQYSAIKIRGKKLYKYARSGTTVEIPSRTVKIHSVSLLEYSFPHVRFSVTCNSGTYIRSLVRDFGELLEIGAYTSQLHRNSIGSFSEEEALPLDPLTFDEIQVRLHPSDLLVSHLPQVTLSVEENNNIVQGKTISGHTAVPNFSPFRIYSETGQFIGIGTNKDGAIKPVKIFL